MDLTIEQSCPSCGAPLILHEADRILQCQFCDVKNIMVGKNSMRFVLPDNAPDDIPREDLLYIPYLRFKGHVFSCRDKEVGYKIVDTTHLGISSSLLPVSLGLRPQAMKVIPATSKITGRFVVQTEKINTIFMRAARLTRKNTTKKKQRIYHRAFIGETLSCIYLPTYFEDEILMDGVSNREIGKIERGCDLFKTQRFQRAWEPRFLSTVCPHCAADMEGEYDSLILICHNCMRAWEEKKGQLSDTDWEVLPTRFSDSRFLPFWRITPKVEGEKLSSFADLLRLTNHPIVIQKDHEGAELALWVPAFKVRAKSLLHLAKGLTFSQLKIPLGSRGEMRRSYPVTLPLSEALQTLKSVIAESVLNKSHFLPKLPQISVEVAGAQLVYLPFCDKGHDFVQEHTGQTIAKAVLRFARRL